jgi:hypothetical protein
MFLDPTLNAIEAKRRIADAQSIATAERLVRGSSPRREGHGVLAAIVAPFRRPAAPQRPKPAV